MGFGFPKKKNNKKKAFLIPTTETVEVAIP